jgi:hypothetical protein
MKDHRSASFSFIPGTRAPRRVTSELRMAVVDAPVDYVGFTIKGLDRGLRDRLHRAVPLPAGYLPARKTRSRMSDDLDHSLGPAFPKKF